MYDASGDNSSKGHAPPCSECVVQKKSFRPQMTFISSCNFGQYRNFRSKAERRRGGRPRILIEKCKESELLYQADI